MTEPADLADPATWDRALQRGRWFAALAPAHQAALLRAGRLKRLADGQRLFSRGEANDGVYAVLDGAVRVGAGTADAREAVLSLLTAPHWFGEIACFDGGLRTHDAHAVGATLLLHVPLSAMEALAAEDPDWWKRWGALLALKVRALFDALEDLAPLPAPQRVARRLLALGSAHGMLAPGVSQRDLPVRQEQLGAMLGLTRQTVSAVLGDLEARGFIRRRYGGVILEDAAGLAAFSAS